LSGQYPAANQTNQLAENLIPVRPLQFQRLDLLTGFSPHAGFEICIRTKRNLLTLVSPVSHKHYVNHPICGGACSG
jgi:hypothetical protein